MLACVPFAFILGFDARAINQEVQRTGAAAIRQLHVQYSLAAAQRAEIGHCPVQSDQLQETLDETSRLPQGHAEQDFHGQTGLDRRIAELLLSTTLAGRRWPPCHPRIEPNRQRSTLLQRIIVSRPVRGLVLCGVPTAHVPQLSCWIHAVNPYRELCNKAQLHQKRVGRI